jgi:4-amino-4-deoxy-L-arabinose transferase-like glycosyltransferase
VLLILLAGFALRWAYLFTIPAFTDELDDVLYSFPVILGEPVPATNFDTFNGGLYTGLIAAVLRVSDLNPGAPRVVSWASGGLTVGATYMLGRVYGGHRVGLIAAALLAVAPAHILVNSHVGWSNSLTPLFTTSALALVGWAVAARKGWPFALAGVAGGLALQTHASVIALIPGLLATLGWQRRWRGLWRWILLAGALFLLVEGPVVAYMVSSNFEPLTYALSHRHSVDRETALTPDRYLQNLMHLLRGLALVVSGWVTDGREAPLASDHPAVLYGSLVAAAGLFGIVLRRRWMLAAPLLSLALILPLLNSRYEPTISNARYVMPMLPPLFVGVGIADILMLERLRQSNSRWLAGALAIGLLSISIAGFCRYITSATDRQLTTSSVRAMTEILAAQDPDVVLLDEQLGPLYTLGGGRVLKSFMVLLNLRGVAYQIVAPGNIQELAGPAGQRQAVLLHATAASIQARYGELAVRPAPLPSSAEGISEAKPFGIYTLSMQLLSAGSGTRVSTCAERAVRAWRSASPGTTLAWLDSGGALVISPAAKTASMALRELDRVQRPVGQQLVICSTDGSGSGYGQAVNIRSAHQLIFLPPRSN